MVEITITRGLVQLKRLDDRITKKINAISEYTIPNKKKEKNVLNGTYTKDAFNKKVKADWESLNTLMSLRNEIKAAIVQSNATTVVEIAGKSYTVAEAIERKSSIASYDMRIVSQLKMAYKRVMLKVEESNAKVEENAQTLFGSSSEETKKSEINRLDMMKTYIDLNAWEVIDPINIKELKDVLDKEVQDFLFEVDEVLSESNSVTKISISQKPSEIN